jgi:hypothetical protein
MPHLIVRLDLTDGAYAKLAGFANSVMSHNWIEPNRR